MNVISLNTQLHEVVDFGGWSRFKRALAKTCLSLRTRRGGHRVLAVQYACGGIKYETAQKPPQPHYARYRNIRKSLEVCV